jgi:beta-1,4-mannosyltransferase
VTGRGPLKEFYDQVFWFRNSRWRKVNIRQAWLEVDDYPLIVAAADVGVCLHYSSSGYDLPMKVVDMFSAQLPCLAIGGYPSIGELITTDERFPAEANGMIFLNAQELAD